jgi:hypothetical protein
VSQPPFAVFLDGPLRDRYYPVDRSCFTRGRFLYRTSKTLDWPEGFEDHEYWLHQAGVFGKLIRAWSLVRPPEQPPWRDAAGILLSGAAKAAIRPLP